MSNGTLYTTYFAKQKKAIGYKIGIVQFTPKWLDLEKENIYNIKELAPSKELLLSYKNNNCDWNLYTKLFNKEMQTREDMVLMLNNIKEVLNKGEDITFICYEKDRSICHRSLLGEHFEKLGYKVREIE